MSRQAKIAVVIPVKNETNKWLENLVKEFDNDVGAEGGMIR